MVGPKSSSNIIRRSKGMGNPERRSQSASGSSQRLLATSNPEIGCNQLGLRRSPRLHPNSAMNMSQSTEMAPSKPGKAPRLIAKGRFDDWAIQFRGTDEKIAKRRRFWRQAEARIFEYSYSPGIASSERYHDISEKRCIVVSDHVFLAHNERSHGITWIAVHGIDSICAVYKNDKSEIKRICDLLGKRLRMQYFGRYLLSEMEDLADSSTYSDKLRGKPFAVVSVYSGTNVDEESCHKAPVAVPDERRAIDFLQGILKPDSIADYETVQTAIAALQHLFHQEFKAEEIHVCVFKDDTSCDPRRSLTTSVIDEHLTTIKRRSVNKPLQLMAASTTIQTSMLE